MKTIFKATIALLIIFTGGTATADEPSERFNRGVVLYQEEKYSEAIDAWMDLYNTGYTDFELLYNIANAWFKSGNISKAILFYERAALRKPWDDDLKYNISLAKSQTRDRYEVIPEIFPVRWFNLLSLKFSSDTWAVLALTAFLATLGAMLMFLFTSRYGIKVTMLWVSVLFFLLFASAISLSLRNRRLVYNSREAVITAPVITGRGSPSEGSPELFIIHEGLKVGVGEKIGEWCEIRLPDGNKGWVPASSFEVI